MVLIRAHAKMVKQLKLVACFYIFKLQDCCSPLLLVASCWWALLLLLIMQV